MEQHIQPGDILFTRGEGFIGWLIRHGSAAYYAHCEILHERLRLNPDGGQQWIVSSAFFKFSKRWSGLRWRLRTIPIREANTPTQFLVLRVWRNETERLALIESSRELTDQNFKYGLDSIFAIALRGVGIHWRPYFNPKSVICSEAVMDCVCKARPHLRQELSHQPRYVWPGLARETLAEQLDVKVIPLPKHCWVAM